jgi:hypothetical protein
MVPNKKSTMLLQSIAEAKIQCAELLANNRFEWKECSPDTIEIDALSPDFYAILDLVREVFGGYCGEMRPPLHIIIDNVEKANIPFEPIRQLWETIIENEYSFGNYNFQLYAKGDEDRCVNVGAIALSS